jgi:hypothetical protein
VSLSLSLFKIPSGPKHHHESSELPAGETKSEYTGRRSARKSDLAQNVVCDAAVFVSYALPSKNAWMPRNRYCNQAVMELCNSMHSVDKILEIVPNFRCVEGCLLFLGKRSRVQIPPPRRKREVLRLLEVRL